MKSFFDRGTWINKENLFPLLELLGYTVNYKLSEDDVDEIKRGLVGTNDETNRWSEYSFGNGRIIIKIARDPDTDIYHLKLHYSEELSAAINVILYTAENFILQNQT